MNIEAPHSPEAEKAVIGSVMLDHTLLDELAYLPPEAFYAERHRVIWRAMRALVARGSEPDNVTLIDFLRVSGDLARVGSVPYLMGLPDETPTAAYAHDYANTVVEHHQRRELIALCMRTAQHATTGDDARDVMERLEADLTTLSRYKALERGPADYHREALDLITGANAASTGFRDLDHVLGGGITRGGFNVVAGRPGMGKSAMLRRIVTNRALQGETCSVFSIDQGGGEMYALEAAMRARTPLHTFRPDKRGVIRATEYNRQQIERELDHLRDVWSQRVRVHDSRADLNSVLAQARSDIRTGSTLIAVDHAQAILVDGKSDETALVSRVSRTLKALCREQNVTLLLISQLGRGVEAREDRRPRLSDLRQSGALEEDANTVLFLYREDYYQARDNPMHTPSNEAEVIVAKNKLGPSPQLAKLVWRSEYAAFEDAARPDQMHRVDAN